MRAFMDGKPSEVHYVSIVLLCLQGTAFTQQSNIAVIKGDYGRKVEITRNCVSKHKRRMFPLNRFRKLDVPH
jgi:hypothetical protein